MEIQQPHAFAFADQWIGYELDAVLDRKIDDQTWLGRCFFDAPDIDANVFVTGENLRAGQMIPVEIMSRDGYDLRAVAIPNDAESSIGE